MLVALLAALETRATSETKHWIGGITTMGVRSVEDDICCSRIAGCAERQKPEKINLLLLVPTTTKVQSIKLANKYS